jgi:hypothetical protein
MSASREAIVEALFALIQQSGDFTTVGRRLVDPEGLDPTESPALFVIEHEDPYDRKQGGFNQLPKREMSVRAIIYNDVGSNQNAIPSTFINNALDKLDTLFLPDSRITNTLTLGNLVLACLIDGAVTRASGDVTGKAMAVVPIRILLP